MKKIVLLSVIAVSSSWADIICIGNYSDDSVTVSFKEGAYNLYECSPEGLGIKSVPLMRKSIDLRPEEQYLVRTEYTFDLLGDVCKFSINNSGEEVNIVDYKIKEFSVNDFTVDVIENSSGSPLEGKAFFSDRMYKITKAKSAPSSSRKS